MPALSAILVVLLLAPSILLAQDAGGGLFRIGNDAFLAGSRVTPATPGIEDTFLAGETVELSVPIAGTGHMLARRVLVSQAVGQNLYAAGMDVSVAAPVDGDATLAGYSLAIRGGIGGKLRASGANIIIAAPVGGTALLAGERIELAAPISGDVAVTARELVFGEGASIGGTLQIYANDPDAISVPASVVPAERITRHRMEQWKGPSPTAALLPGWRDVIRRFLLGVVAIGAVAALVAAVAPGPLDDMRRRLLARPFATLGWGFLSLSALLGSAIVIGLTLIGLLVTPALLVLAAVAGFAGYVVGAYSFGAGILGLFRAGPGTPGWRAVAAFAGVVAAALVALIPFLGWLFVLALTLAGLGALILNLFRPSFYAEPSAA
jgi:hypothetical protein